MKDLNWHEISITHFILFFYWIGTENKNPNSYLNASIYMFTVFADYFQLTDLKQKDLLNEIRQIRLENIYELMGKYLKIKYIPWIYMKEILMAEFINYSFARIKITRIPPGGKYEETVYPISLPKSNLKFVDLQTFYLKILLDWLDEDNLSVENFFSSSFINISNFIQENKKKLISENSTYMIALLRNYRIVHRVVNLLSFLELGENTSRK